MKKLSKHELDEVLGGANRSGLNAMTRLSVESLHAAVYDMGFKQLAHKVAKLDANTITAEAFYTLAADAGLALDQIIGALTVVAIPVFFVGDTK